jgi:hypothetical protein
MSPSLARSVNFVAETLESRLLLSAATSPNQFISVTGDTSAGLVAAPSSPPVLLPLEASPDSTTAPTGLTPMTIRHAYGIDQITFNGGTITGDGSGQTIAIVDAFDNPGLVSSTNAGFNASDLHQFDQQFSLPDPTFTKVEVGGTPGTNTGWGLEIDLDVEWAHVIAPKANIILFEALDNSTSNLLAAVNAAENTASVNVITMSWGALDNGAEPTFESSLVTPAGHQGITFFASTGDSGAPGVYPGASPNVVGVGGTTLNTSGNNYVSEVGWSSGGGGITEFAKPPYQSGVTQSTTKRTIPDIAFDADPNSGVPVYDVQYSGASTPWTQVGGTSLSSPCWAALIAIADQGMVASGSVSLNGTTQTLPLLYKLTTADFHDITSGYNGYYAGVGYDLVTGIGTPIANQLIPDLVQAANPFLHVVATTPPGGGDVFGTAPTTFTATLSNPADPATIQTNDFNVNGVTPSSVTLDATETVLTLHYGASPVTTAGAQTLNVTAGAVKRLSDGSAIVAYSSGFVYEATQLQVTSSTPNASTQGPLPLTTITVNLNAPVSPPSVTPASLTLSQGTVTAATLLSGNTSIAYTVSGITSEAFITASIAAGALTDQYGAGCAAFSVTFATDAVGAQSLAAVTSVAPLGSWIYQTSANGVIGIPSDTDNYTITLNPGQNLSLVVHPTSGALIPSVSLMDPSSNLLGSVTAGAAGQDAVLQSIPITTAGTYTVVVGGNGSTIGSYALEGLLNAAVEMAEHGGPSDTTIATAQNLDPAFNAITSGSAVASVLGALNVTSNDFYAVTLVAGQSLTAAETNLTGSGLPTLKLFNPAGAVAATGLSGPTNVGVDIAGFVAPTSGVYDLQVAGSATGSTYSLVVTKNAGFSLEPHNSFATAQNIDGTSTVIGDISPGLISNNLVVPNTLANTSGDGGNYFPFGTYQMRYQQIYSASQFGAGGTISALRFRRPAGVSAYSAIDPIIQIDLAYAATKVSSPSTTFANNVGAGDTTVFSGSLSLSSTGTGSPNPFDVVIPLSQTFTYDPTKGDLLMDVRMTQGANNTQGLDATDTAQQTVTTRIWEEGNVNATTGTVDFTGGGGYYGLVTRFDFSATTPTNDWYSLDATSLSQSLAFSTAIPSQGTGQFGDLLDPHIEIYDPNNNLVASGVKLADGRNEVVAYQPLVTGTYRVHVSSQNGTTGEYILNQGNAILLNLPANVKKGDGIDTGTLTLSSAPTSNVTINLTSGDPTRLGVPATVVVLAGQTSVSVPLTVVDDHLLDGPDSVVISASATGYFGGSETVAIHDNQTATLSMTLPSNVTKGQGSITGTITSSAAPADNIIIQLSSSAASELSVPATVTLLAGQTSVNFGANALQDTVIDGTQNVTVTSSVENWTSGSASVAIADDNNTIAVTLPASGWEGQVLQSAGTIQIGGTSASNEIISLTSSNPAELSVPATVTVLAGQTTATFTVTLLNDGVKHAPLATTVTATASGLVTGTGSIIVHDNTLDHLVFASPTGSVVAGVPFSDTVTAYNSSNEVIVDYTGTATLSAAGASPSEPITPTLANFSSGVWSGSITLTTADPGVTLTAKAGGLSASSNSFAVNAGAVASFSLGSVPSPQIANVPFSETVTAMDSYGNVATGFNGSANLTGLVGSTVSSTIFNGTPYYYGTGSWTDGYSFTPNTTLQVTAFRSYFGTKCSIWTLGGTLITSQAVSGTPGVWTATPLTTPVTLQAGTTYIITCYTGGGSEYYSASTPISPSFGQIGIGYTGSGDGYPAYGGGDYWVVDLQVNVGAFTPVPLTPSTATFTNGVWTGNVDVTQGETGMHLHVADTNGHIGDSPNFDVILQTLSLSGPTNVTKGQGTVESVLNISPVPTSNLTVTLASSDPTRLTVPNQITVEAGQTSVLVPITVIDDHEIDGLQTVTISATATNYSSASDPITIHDSQTGALTLSLPSEISEGAATVTGTITASAAPAQNLTINLTSSNTGQATVPTTVTLLAGQTTATFSLAILDNKIIEGTDAVTVEASADNWVEAYGTVLVDDIDNVLTVTLPTSGWEGQSFPNGGTVTIGGTDSNSLTISLAASNPGDMTIPATVTIPAGQTSVTFNVALLSYSVKDGLRTDTITATASGLTTGSGSITVHDATPDHLSFSSIAGPESDAVAFPVTLSVENIDNEVIPTYTGTATLSAAGTGAPSLSITPTVASFAAGLWTGSVTIGGVNSATTISATTSGGTTGTSNPFVLQAGAVSSFQWGSVSTQTQNVPFSETVTAQDINGFTASFNGTVNLSGISGAGVGTKTILLFQDSHNHYFQSALTALGLSYATYTTENAFDTALSAANPSSTLAIVDEPNNLITLAPVPAYISAGGRMILEYWHLEALSSIDSIFGASVITPVYTPIPIYDWGGSSFFKGLTSPLNLSPNGYNENADEMQPTAAGTAVAGFQSVVTANSAAVVVANSGRTILDGFLIDDAASAAAIQFAENEIQSDLSVGTPISIAPTTATFVNGVWTGNITVAQSASGMHLHVDDGSGQTGDSATFNVLPAATAAPVLLAATDSGLSSSDGVTNFNNSSPAKALEFSVAGTGSGDTVTIYANGIAIGSAVATGTTVTVTTDGKTLLSDGPYSITAQRMTSGGLQSAMSPGSMIMIDTATPTPTIAPVSPNPISQPISTLTITFSKPVYGLQLSSLGLSLNSGANLLTSAQTLTTTDNTNWTLGNLSSLTGANGTYTVSLAAGAAESTAGNLSSAASQTWQNNISTIVMVTPAGGTPNPVTGSSTALSVAATEGGYPLSLTYTWTYTGAANVTFTGNPNGTSAAGNITANFTAAGNYDLIATISDGGGNSITSTATVVVNQTATTISLSSTASVVPVGFKQLFTPTVTDQFGNSIASPTINWTITGDVNSIDPTGNATLGSTPGTYTVTATDGIAQGTATVTAENFAVPAAASLGVNLGGAGPVTLSTTGGIITATQAGVQISFAGITGVSVTDAASNDALNVNGTFTQPFTFTGCASSTINVGGSMTFAAQPGGQVSLGALSLAAGASAAIAPTSTASPTTLVLNSISIGATATLDLSNNAMLINYGAGTDPIASIAGWIKSGYNGGAWNGNGIFSSTAHTHGNYALGYADSVDPHNPANLPSGQIKVIYTLFGDANLDGEVNGIDFALMAAHFGKTISGWDAGDFNYDGEVNGIDFAILAQNFGHTAVLAAVAQVPAPAVAPVAAAVVPVTASSSSQTVSTNLVNSVASVSLVSNTTLITSQNPSSRPAKAVVAVSKPAKPAATSTQNIGTTLHKGIAAVKSVARPSVLPTSPASPASNSPTKVDVPFVTAKQLVKKKQSR